MNARLFGSCIALGASFSCCFSSAWAASLVNFETAPIHPVALSPDGQTLTVCNLPDGRVELFNVVGGIPIRLGDVPVGVDPVSLRFRTADELWVVNHISSSVSVVDVAAKRILATLDTKAGPCDIVFAGSPRRAFVSCAKENLVQVFDPITRAVVTNLVIDGDRPKAMAVSPDGLRVYVAIFESGNGSTILARAGTGVDDAGTNSILADPSGPYGGQTPVPNDGPNLSPSLYMDPNVDPFFYTNGQPTSIIVKKNAAGQWMDDNNGNWTPLVSGTNSALTGRPPGWDMPDRDVAIINTASYAITYATGLMNICMDVAVNPASGEITVVGTDGTNERRFEPNLRGTFIRVELATVDPETGHKTIRDLNAHLDYQTYTVAQSVRDQSIGDPRGIVWNGAGTRGYVTGMGSRNLVIIDANGNRVTASPIQLGDGPTGLALDESRQRLYVLNRFSATLSVLDTTTLSVVTNVSFFDPTPATIKAGRKYLYDTRKNSGLGQLACASCHVDARFDRLGWDLGNPAIAVPNASFHPMKGPLVTQTLQDIIGSEPLHWRGDRSLIDDFNVTFTDLLGADRQLTPEEMQEFRDFLATIHFPPNRFRNFDNSLPTNVPLPGFYSVSESGVPDRTPLPNGDALRGLAIFGQCVSCHGVDTGRGVQNDEVLIGRNQKPLKIAQLRSIPDKLGMDLLGPSSRTGFGFRFDGRSDTLTRFLRDVFAMTNSQEIADLSAFLLAFTGSDLDNGSGASTRDAALPGIGLITQLFKPSQDAPAALGRQITLTSAGSNALVHAMLALADSPKSRVDLIARGVKDGLNRAWVYDRASVLFQSDRNQETISLVGLQELAAPGRELTFTLVPRGTGRRLGIDRDEDGYCDRTELDLGFDPADALSHGSNSPPRLQDVSSFAVHPGMTVSLTFGATDPDAGQSLAWAMLRDMPAGATFNSSNGLFTWVPTPEQSERTYRLGVQVTDNGSPPLSDTLALEFAVVTLRIVRLEPAPPMYTGWWIRIEGIPDRLYLLQAKDRLNDPSWTDVGSAGVGSTGQSILVDDTPLYQRFYRIRVLP